MPIRILGLFLTMFGTLNADTISYVLTTPGSPISGQPTPWSDTVPLPKFDLPGATLTGVDFNLIAFIGVSVQATNPISSTATFTYHTDGSVNADFPYAAPTATGLYVYLPTGGSFSEPPGPFSYVGPILSGSKSYSLRGSQKFLAPYIGTGALSVLIFGGDSGPDGQAPGAHLFGPSGLIPGLSTNSTAQLTVTYSYATEVPEPASIAQLACAFLLLGCIVRTRKWWSQLPKPHCSVKRPY